MYTINSKTTKVIANKTIKDVKWNHKKYLIQRKTGYKVNVRKSIASLHTSNEQLEFEIRNTTPFILAQRERERERDREREREILRCKPNKVYTNLQEETIKL